MLLTTYTYPQSISGPWHRLKERDTLYKMDRLLRSWKSDFLLDSSTPSR